MGLFDIFKKKTIQCARCSAAVNENAAREYNGRKYCAYCHGVVSSGAGQNNGGQNRGGQNYGGQNHGGQNHGGQNYGGQNRGGQNHGGQNHGSQNYGGQSYGGSEHPAIKDIRQAFDALKIHYHVNHIGNQWELVAGVNGKANTYQVKFISKDDSKCDVAIRIFGLAHYPDHRRRSALPIPPDSYYDEPEAALPL